MESRDLLELCDISRIAIVYPTAAIHSLGGLELAEVKKKSIEMLDWGKTSFATTPMQLTPMMALTPAVAVAVAAVWYAISNEIVASLSKIA